MTAHDIFFTMETTMGMTMGMAIEEGCILLLALIHLPDAPPYRVLRVGGDGVQQPVGPAARADDSVGCDGAEGRQKVQRGVHLVREPLLQAGDQKREGQDGDLEPGAGCGVACRNAVGR